MFTCDNPNVIKCSEGWSVQVLGPTGLRYQQGNRWLRVSSEWLASPGGLVMYTSSIKQWAEPNYQPVTDSERETIIENICRAFAFRKIDVGVV